jgi:integrase
LLAIGRDHSADAQRRGLRIFKGCLRDAVRLGVLAESPAALVDLPRVRRVRRGLRALDAGQAVRFLDAAQSDRLYAMYVVGIDSGMRPGELFALHWPEVDLAAGTVSVRRSLEDIDGHLRLKEPKTPESLRTIPLSPRSVAALAAHRERMRDEGRDVETGPVFVSLWGHLLRGPNVLRRSFRPTLQRAGLPIIRMYDMRHTCATLLLAAGVPLRTVSERLGHASPTLTLANYAHVLPTMQQAAAEAMGKILGPADRPPLG